MLAFFEIGLIVLIMLTQGPALYAFTTQLPIRDTMSNDALRLWTVGLGTYGALMLAAAGVAYRIQPSDTETVSVLELERLLSDKEALHIEERDSLDLCLRQANANAQYWRSIVDLASNSDWYSAHGIAMVAGLLAKDGSMPKPGPLAKALSETVPVVRDALEEGAKMRRQSI